MFRRLAIPTLVALPFLAACGTLADEPEGALRKEMVYAVTDAAELIKFNAGQPRRILERKPVTGLAAGDSLVGIDFRVARGVLYALSARGQLYTLATSTGQLQPVGATPVPMAGGVRYGFDFNPVADRIRLVADNGANLRLHPDTGAVAATDGTLAYAPRDASFGKAPQIAGAAYTYNKTNDKLTTNYAIDRALGMLVTQGSKEGAEPVVSPNTGQLYTVGALGTGPVDNVSFDIADVGNTALAALTQGGRTRLHLIDLANGRATLLGSLGDGRAVWGLAIEP